MPSGIVPVRLFPLTSLYIWKATNVNLQVPQARQLAHISELPLKRLRIKITEMLSPGNIFYSGQNLKIVVGKIPREM